MLIDRQLRAVALPDSEPCVSMIVRRYLRYIDNSGRFCPEAFVERKRTLSRFADALGNIPVSECRPFHLTDWIEAHSNWKSISTRGSKARAVKACFAWAAREQRIRSNPFAALRYDEAEPRAPMDDATLAQLLQNANQPFERALRFLRLTGCRLSGLCRMTWPDVDLDAGVIVLQHHKSRRTKCRSRPIVLLPEAVDLLIELGRDQGETLQGVVFRNHYGTAWTRRALGQALRRLKIKTGIRSAATLHGIRHQFATVAVRQGAPIKLVSLQLGHSSVSVTERYYLHLDQDLETIRDAIKLAMPK